MDDGRWTVDDGWRMMDTAAAAAADDDNNNNDDVIVVVASLCRCPFCRNTCRKSKACCALCGLHSKHSANHTTPLAHAPCIVRPAMTHCTLCTLHPAHFTAHLVHCAPNT